MVSMVLCLVVGQSTADSYSKCYEDCVVDCLYTIPGKTPQGCMRLCVGQCSGSSGSTLSVHEDDTRYFCNIGRATSVCAKLAAKENPAGAKQPPGVERQNVYARKWSGIDGKDDSDGWKSHNGGPSFAEVVRGYRGDEVSTDSAQKSKPCPRIVSVDYGRSFFKVSVTEEASPVDFRWIKETLGLSSKALKGEIHPSSGRVLSEDSEGSNRATTQFSMPDQERARGKFRGQMIPISDSIQIKSPEWQVKRKPRKESNKRFVKSFQKGFKVERAAMDYSSKGFSDKVKAVLLKKARVKPFPTCNPQAKLVIDKKRVVGQERWVKVGPKKVGHQKEKCFIGPPNNGLDKDPNISDSPDERDCIRPLKAFRVDPSKGRSPLYLVRYQVLVIQKLGMKLRVGAGESDERSNSAGVTLVSSTVAIEEEGFMQASVLVSTVTSKKRGRPQKSEQAAKNRKVLPQVHEVAGVEMIGKIDVKGTENNWYLDVEIAKVGGRRRYYKKGSTLW
ncbi:hypothetical protein EZV62_004065 [Acer yangbiense]|uniref:Uncharacterized protein n=1 Tax=Acer yangbiense TaxID=1000413 RepID=A0A5C7IIM2_9ROSI|nr:hypothetical protein EZV62_004065 [Acer yangbiense]